MLHLFSLLLLQTAAAVTPEPLPALAKRTMASTVAVLTLSEDAARAQHPVADVAGSGVIVAPQIVATCAHVLKRPYVIRTLHVALDTDNWAGGTVKMYVATVVDQDPALDLAFLLVRGLPGDPVVLATDASELAIGEDAFFLGHPFVVPSLGLGVIASGEAKITAEDGNARPMYRLDGSVNHGNSGGGVFSRRTGHLLGLVHGKAGGLSDPLKQLKDYRPGGRAAVMGVDLLGAFREVLISMETNLQLGVGAFLGAEHIVQPLRGVSAKK